MSRFRGAKFIETASWQSDTYHSRLKPIHGVYHHGVSEAVFQRVETPVNYAYKGER